MKKHINIPIFIPHLGCPNMCVFCNQRTISGVKSFECESVIPIIETALATVPSGTEAEIAFFGGSFTGIDRDLMVRLLEIAYSYVSAGKVTGIRCSTRPDYINEQILEILKEYGVKVIELGLQSVDEDVLRTTKRGHGFTDEEYACKLIVDNGFTLVGQMMIGLPGSTLEQEIKTAEFIISSGAKGARIYPTVVFRDTELCSMAERGEYQPLKLDEAVKRSSEIMTRFLKAGVGVIRIGLCASENLSSHDTYSAGPNHPALGELVENEVFYKIIENKIKEHRLKSNSDITVSVAKGALSKAIGQKKKNKLRLSEFVFPSKIVFCESDSLKGYEVSVKVQER